MKGALNSPLPTGIRNVVEKPVSTAKRPISPMARKYLVLGFGLGSIMCGALLVMRVHSSYKFFLILFRMSSLFLGDVIVSITAPCLFKIKILSVCVMV